MLTETVAAWATHFVLLRSDQHDTDNITDYEFCTVWRRAQLAPWHTASKGFHRQLPSWREGLRASNPNVFAVSGCPQIPQRGGWGENREVFGRYGGWSFCLAVGESVG